MRKKFFKRNVNRYFWFMHNHWDIFYICDNTISSYFCFIILNIKFNCSVFFLLRGLLMSKEIEFWQNHLAKLYIKLLDNENKEETIRRIENAEKELDILLGVL